MPSRNASYEDAPSVYTPNPQRTGDTPASAWVIERLVLRSLLYVLGAFALLMTGSWTNGLAQTGYIVMAVCLAGLTCSARRS